MRNSHLKITSHTMELIARFQGYVPKTAQVAPYAKAVRRLVHEPLVSEQFDALVSFAYNVGIGAFERSTLLKVLNMGRPDLVGAEMRRWVYADGKRLRGLVRRRDAEARLFETFASAPASTCPDHEQSVRCPDDPEKLSFWQRIFARIAAAFWWLPF